MSRAGPPSPLPPPIALARDGRARLRGEARAAESQTQTERDVPVIDRDGAIAPLRLAIGKDGLGIELAGPATVECLDVVELVVRLPHVKFPFDVSGGVAKFRHKRGELERVGVELDARRVARWAEPRLRGLLATGPCTVIVEPRAFGATVTVHARSNASSTTKRAGVLAALAFEVAVVPTHEELALVVHGARGAHLVEPATALAIRAVATLVGDAARREGARFVMPDAAGRLARRLLPEAGVRAPGSEGMRMSGSGESDGVLFVAFARAAGSLAKVPDEATLAVESAMLTREADDARMARDLDLARQLDLAAFERAPRHPEIARRIAEVDSVVGGRAETASATLREMATPVHLGLLAGNLMNEAGDRPGAVAALLRVGERDPSNVIGALAYARAAELALDPHDALAWLDAAIARAPRLAELRWERARRRLTVGRLGDARVDFQELEALAHGARDRHDVLRRAGDAYRAAGLGADAAQLYERALLYRPDDPEALAGLGAALAAEGRAARGAAILAHAVEIAETRGIETSWMHLELGRVLGERLGDRPAAVARLRAVPDDAPEAIAARGLEGRLRAQLGDPSGASLAFARMRERAGHEAIALAWLEEAARFEDERGDLHAAQRHLASAIGIAPGDGVLEARYRALGERIAAAAGVRGGEQEEEREREREREREEERERVRVADQAYELAREQERDREQRAAEDDRTRPRYAIPESLPDVTGGADDAEAELRVEALTRTLQGDPNNDAVVDELVGHLSKLGRSMDLLALLSARLEDAPPDRREALLPKHREVLLTLEREARAEGRDAEADLFKMAREAS
ncbi:MAG: domain protein putative component of TonB system [Myxococcaceae bacterium]|nr:domain protein putative component of TonB system [Myxococcaceae bacterium]